MSGYSWINPSDAFGLFFDIKRIAPIKMTNDAILALPGNYMMYGTRRDAIEELISEIEELTLMDVFRDILKEKPLAWKNKTSLKQYAMSRFAMVVGPPIIILAVPFMKFRMKQFKRFINKEHPEWLV